MKIPKILDFGADGNGLPQADWVDEGGGKETPFGHRNFDVWVRPGVPIPCPDNEYDLINVRYALTHNPTQNWEFILSELKRVSAPGCVIVIVECNSRSSNEPDLNKKWITETFRKVWPEYNPLHPATCLLTVEEFKDGNDVEVVIRAVINDLRHEV